METSTLLWIVAIVVVVLVTISAVSAKKPDNK